MLSTRPKNSKEPSDTIVAQCIEELMKYEILTETELGEDGVTTVLRDTPVIIGRIVGFLWAAGLLRSESERFVTMYRHHNLNDIYQAMDTKTGNWIGSESKSRKIIDRNVKELNKIDWNQK